MKTYYTAKELASLPEMPGTERAVQMRADRESWPWRKRAGRGGGREYALASLPRETQDYLAHQHLDHIAATLPAVKSAAQLPAVIQPAALPALTDLTKHQTDVMDARMWFVRLLQNRPKGQSVKKAQHAIVKRVGQGERPYAQMAAAANDRQGKDRTLSQRTLMRWWMDSDHGKTPAALAPRDADAQRVARDAVLVAWCRDYKPSQRHELPSEVPAWLPYFLDAYRNPQKPAITSALDDMKKDLPPDIGMPSYEQASRICEKIPEVYLQKYRMTGAEYRSLCGFHRRDFSMDDPFTVGQIDGHSFKAYVAHPTTGAHFHPEVCGIICMTSKVLAGFSIGQAESAQTVADAVRHACTVDDKKPWGGIFAIIEADRGAGNLAKVNSDELTGRFSRLNITFLPPEQGGNPQGHGGIERSNQSIWIKAAKKLPTYTGKDMDRCVRKKVYIKLERDLKEAEKAGKLGAADKTSKLLLSWQEFHDYLWQWMFEYNNAPHTSLPKITDQNGKRRHMSPFEYLAHRMTQGWQPVTLDQDMLEHLFMPHEQIRVNRCEFVLRGNRYHAYDLHQYHGRHMIAAYDIHNAEHVYVMDLDERLICRATWNGNKKTGQPTPVKEQAIMERAEGQIKLLEKRIALRQMETREAVVIEHSSEINEARNRLIEEMKQEQAIDTGKVTYLQPPSIETPVIEDFKIPSDAKGKYLLWCKLDGLITGGVEVSEREMRFYKGFRTTPDYRGFRGIEEDIYSLRT